MTSDSTGRSEIRRMNTNQRMSGAVVHGGTVYLAGQVGTPGGSVSEQTREVLAQIDALLAQAGTDKTRVLQAIIWLADMADFAEMNAVWDSWVAPGCGPARATGESKLAAPGYRVEIIVTAAA
jgi:enamine deaminase RidA (YjgF/YER057c/UK114 family)